METSEYRFYSEVRVFISDLFRNFFKAQPSQYLKDRGFNKKKLVNELLSRKVIERSEKILDQSNSDKKEPTYRVKYSLYDDNIDRKLNRMYIQHFKKNMPEKKKKSSEINEEGGASSCGSVGGSFEKPIGPLISRTIYESKNVRKIVITEEQFNLLQDTINVNTLGDIDEATTLSNTGSVGDYTANGLVLKTSDGKKDPCYNR